MLSGGARMFFQKEQLWGQKVNWIQLGRVELEEPVRGDLHFVLQKGFWLGIKSENKEACSCASQPPPHWQHK